MNEVAQMNENAGPYKGLDRYEARENVIAILRAGGFLVGTKDYVVPLGKCDRCKTIVEPRLSTQWFVKIQPLADRAIEVVEKRRRSSSCPEKYTKTYFEWMRNIHDWCISRQLWWGHRIPAWHCKNCGEIIVARERRRSAEVRQRAYRAGQRRARHLVLAPGCCRSRRLGWPDKTPDLDAFYPTDAAHHRLRHPVLLGGAHDHAELPLHARQHKQGDVPFRNVHIHGLVRDAERQKMSKTKGNVMDPIEIIEKFGTDAVRFTLAAMAAPGTDIAFSESRTESYRAFANKIWNAARFLFMNVDRAAEQDVWSLANSRRTTADFRRTEGGIEGSPVRATLEDRWILSRFNRVAQEIDDGARRVSLPRSRARRLSLLLGRILRLVCGADQAATAHRRPRAGARRLRQPDQHLRGRAAHAVAVHAVHHRGALACGVRWQAAGEVDCAGRAIRRPTGAGGRRRPRPRWRFCRT